MMKRVSSAFCALSSLSLFLSLSPALGVERDEPLQEEETFNKNTRQNSKLGFEAESKLAAEPAGRSYFRFTNDEPWPEKKELPPPPKPAAPVKAPVHVEPQVTQIESPDGTTSSDEKHPPSPDTNVKISAHAKSGRAADKQPAGTIKKPRRQKSPVAMPDIEQLLADVRRGAQPKLPSEPAQAPTRTQDALSAVVPVPSSNEVEGNVDMDALARDLALLQKNTEPASAVPAAKNARVVSEESKSRENAWWKICALVTGAAAAGVGLYFGAAAAIRRRKRHIRSQAQIDSETRVFFDKLLAEQRRRAARPAAPAPFQHAAPQPPPESPVEIPENMAEPPEFQRETEPEPEPERGPGVFLLPPELAEGAYKEAVTLAARGESPRVISEKLNLGEGEVRLVLDIARLTRERLQMA